jgi:DeoR family fructose operon transcriptional repressor
MSATNRRFELLNLVRSHGRLEVTSATSVLGVSHETIRRDLRLLESQGLISRTYGVAHPVESGAFESSLDVRADINPPLLSDSARPESSSSTRVSPPS